MAYTDGVDPTYGDDRVDPLSPGTLAPPSFSSGHAQTVLAKTEDSWEAKVSEGPQFESAAPQETCSMLRARF